MSIAPKAHEVLDWILRDDQGEPRWLFQLSGKIGSAFLPTGLLDFLDLDQDPSDPPPSGRVRMYFKDGLLYINGGSGPAGGGPGSLALWQLADVDDGTAPAAGRLLVGHKPAGEPAHWQALPMGVSGYVLQANEEAEGGVAWTPAGLGASPAAVPGYHLLGDPLSYFAQGSVITASEVQFSRVYLIKGQVFSLGRVYQVKGGSTARYFRIGVYGQADPTDDSGVPLTKLVETAQTDTGAAFNGSYRDIPWTTGNWTVPETGWFWIAFITDTTTPLQWSVTGGPYPAGFLPVYRQASALTTLPATASGLTNPASSVVFCALKEA